MWVKVCRFCSWYFISKITLQDYIRLHYVLSFLVMQEGQKCLVHAIFSSKNWVGQLVIFFFWKFLSYVSFTYILLHLGLWRWCCFQLIQNCVVSYIMPVSLSSDCFLVVIFLYEATFVKLKYTHMHSFICNLHQGLAIAFRVAILILSWLLWQMHPLLSLL